MTAHLFIMYPTRKVTAPSGLAAATIQGQPSLRASASIRFRAAAVKCSGSAERFTWTPTITPARIARRSKTLEETTMI